MSASAVVKATGTFRIAPTEERIALGPNGSAQPGRSSTPLASNAAARRTIVPTLPGSCTPSSATATEERRARIAAASKRGRSKRPRTPCECRVSESESNTSADTSSSRRMTAIGVQPPAMASATGFGPSMTISESCSRMASRMRLTRGFCLLRMVGIRMRRGR